MSLLGANWLATAAVACWIKWFMSEDNCICNSCCDDIGVAISAGEIVSWTIGVDRAGCIELAAGVNVELGGVVMGRDGVVEEAGGNDGAAVTFGGPSPTACKTWYSLWAITDLDPEVTRCLDDR